MIKIPIIAEEVTDLGETLRGLNIQSSDPFNRAAVNGMINPDEIVYCLESPEGTGIFLRSGSVSEELYRNGQEFCCIVTPLSIDELYDLITEI